MEYVDSIGNWGIKNNKLCGIGYKRCSWRILGYDYCSSINPEVAFTNEKMVLGGFEDDEWCGIGEMIHDTSIRIKNSKSKKNV